LGGRMDAPPPPGICERARAELHRILSAHEPEPLDELAQAELRAILDAATAEQGL
jgi:hypothetical protein